MALRRCTAHIMATVVVMCYRCGEKGHLAEIYRKEATRFVCGAFGHKSFYCPRRGKQGLALRRSTYCNVLEFPPWTPCCVAASIAANAASAMVAGAAYQILSFSRLRRAILETAHSFPFICHMYMYVCAANVMPLVRSRCSYLGLLLIFQETCDPI